MVNYSLAYMNSQPGNPDGKKKYYAKAGIGELHSALWNYIKNN